MRKFSWLAMGCVATFVAQALVAADTVPVPRNNDPAASRSRLLIFSRSKEKVRPADDVENAPPTSRTTADRMTPAAEPAQATARSARPTGNTGTFSPRSAAQTATKPRSAHRTARSQMDLPPSTDDDELIRQLFESDELEREQAALQAELQSQKSTTPRTAQQSAITSPRTTAHRTTAHRTTAPRANPSTSTASRIDSERELFETSLPTAPVGDDAHSLQAETAGAGSDVGKASPNRQVSATADDASHFEIDSFESATESTNVVNAGFQDNGAKNEIRPISASSAARFTGKGPAGGPQAKTRTPAAKPIKTSRAMSVKPSAGSLLSPTPQGRSVPAAANLTASKGAASSASSAAGLSGSQTPQVSVNWEARGEVTLGQECQCALVVHNSGKSICRDLIVEASFPESVRLVNAMPFPKASSAKLEWAFAELAAGEKKLIELTIVPTKPGELGATAQVRFTGTAATSFTVSEPKLTASVKASPEVRIGEPASAIVTISNPGTGTAQNVVLKASLPEGLEYQAGREYSTDIGPLGPGETRVVRVGLLAVGGGEQQLKLTARSGNSDLEAAAEVGIKVLAPSLQVVSEGPGLRYLNRAARYSVTVTNNSNAACDNVRVTQDVEPGFNFIKAGQSGRWDAQRRLVSWYLGRMEPGQATTVEVDLMPTETGEFKQQFRATGDAGLDVASIVDTRVEGAASLVMEVKDVEDPIEIGSDMTYTIRVRNEGSKSAGNVAISCELPPDLELAKVDAPTEFLMESGMLIFKPVAEIPAGTSVTYKVTVKGLAAGTMKLRARLTSESIQKPLIVEEATQFYSE